MTLGYTEKEAREDTDKLLSSYILPKNVEVVKEEFNVRSLKDHRTKVNRITIAIHKPSGEYRKGFEFPKDTTWEDMMNKIKCIIQNEIGA